MIINLATTMKVHVDIRILHSIAHLLIHSGHFDCYRGVDYQQVMAYILLVTNRKC